LIIEPARRFLAATLIVVALFLDHAAVPAYSTPQTADCQAPVWGDEAAAFETRLEAYVALRAQLETALQARGHALAVRIRTARAQAKQGDMLTPALSVEIRKSFRREINPHTWQVIMDDNPGELPSQVNDEYREGQPLATMPPNMLAALPKLPKDIEYRFIDRHLVLLDTRSMIILDRIPYAIRYADSQNACR
jgi:hypothetical protein